MNNRSTISIPKAGLLTCLFCWVMTSQAQHPDWITTDQLSRAYAFTLNLQVEESRKITQTSTDPQAYYVASLTDALELLITEDRTKFDAYEEAVEKRLDDLSRRDPQTGATLFAAAELRLQWAFVYLKFGHEFDAAWSIRQAYLQAAECSKKFPTFSPIGKTTGLLEVMLGSVPEKYQWVLSLLNMNGSVEKGLQDLEQVKQECPSLSFEAELLHHLVQGFVLQQTSQAVKGLEEEILPKASHSVALFLASILAVKNSESEKALTFLNILEKKTDGLPIRYSQYVLGEVLLHKGEYVKSIEAYQQFMKLYAGENYIKDAAYKTGICYWLNHNKDQAAIYFSLARKSGRESTEADKHAARSLSENTFPNARLAKIRYATDGGYYSEAMRLVKEIQPNEIISIKDQTEFAYRQARLSHKTGQLGEAREFYRKTIETSGAHPWYFAPNSCLQLGYILWEEKNYPEAQLYFEMALNYKKHEYKNSIDSKAKSALEKLRREQQNN